MLVSKLTASLTGLRYIKGSNRIKSVYCADLYSQGNKSQFSTAAASDLKGKLMTRHATLNSDGSPRFSKTLAYNAKLTNEKNLAVSTKTKDSKAFKYGMGGLRVSLLAFVIYAIFFSIDDSITDIHSDDQK